MAQLCCPTTKLQKLLLSSDGSEFSSGAIREAIKFAKACSGKLYVMAVVEANEEFEALAPQLVEKEENKIREHLENVKAQAAKEGVDCETIAHHGDDPYRLIVEDAAKKKVDLIIMGRRGRTGLKRLMMGSVTAKVIGHSPCKVLVIPSAAKIDWKNLVVATDGSTFGTTAVLEAINIAKQCGGTLTIVSVVSSDALVHIEHSRLHLKDIAEKEIQNTEKNVKELKELAQKEGVKAEGVILSGNPAEAIISTAKEKNADLIMLGSHGRTGLDRLLMGSVTERVIVLSPCAVMVVKTK